MRLPTPAPPAEISVLDGLAYTLWLPDKPPLGGVLVLHGAGSCKENHHDMARAARSAGFAAVCFDMRGHGESEGALDGRAIADVALMASLLPRPLALRGSSMGGYLAIAAADAAGAAAVVAVCPASADMLRRGLASGAFDFRADELALDALLAEHPLEGVSVPLLLLHARADERVPYEHSVALHEATAGSKLIVVPGGDHRSVQHDAELQGVSLRFVRQAFEGRATPPPTRSSPR